MTSSPIYAVPKSHSSDFRLVTDPTVGQYSLNSMVPYDAIAGFLDNMKHMGEFLLCIREYSDQCLTLWKSDVAYRLIPMHSTNSGN